MIMGRKCRTSNSPHKQKFVLKSYRLEVRPRSTSDEFPSRVIIGCALILPAKGTPEEHQ